MASRPRLGRNLQTYLSRPFCATDFGGCRQTSKPQSRPLHIPKVSWGMSSDVKKAPMKITNMRTAPSLATFQTLREFSFSALPSELRTLRLLTGPMIGQGTCRLEGTGLAWRSALGSSFLLLYMDFSLLSVGVLCSWHLRSRSPRRR